MVALASLSALSAATIAAVIQSVPAFAATPTTTVTYQGTDTATQYEGYTVTVGTFPAGTFDDNAVIHILECAGTTTAPPADGTSCDAVTGNTSLHSNADGSFSGGSYRIFLVGVAGYVFQHAGGVVIDASGTNPGVLYIGEDPTDFTQPHGFANFNIGLYGELVNQTATFTAPRTALPAGGASVTVNAVQGAPTIDSAQRPLTFTGFAPTTPNPTDGTVPSCTAAGACTYTSNSTFTGTPTSDTFGVSATATDSSGAVNITPAVVTVPLAHPIAPTVTPTPNPASASSNAAGTTVAIAPNASGTDSGGNAETITAVTPSATTGGFGSTVTCATTTSCTYTVGAGAPAGGGTDTFTLTATASGLTSAPVTVTVDIPPSYVPACDATTGTGSACSLDQIVNIPVTAGDLTMGQSGGLPVDTLGNTLIAANGACSGPAIKLNGQPQYACGDMAPITIVNARGTDAGWDLTGQITDFIDSGKVTATSLTPGNATTLGTLNSSCDTVATYNNHCIPGDNAGWLPAAAVAQNIVPGDVAEVSPGSNVSAPGFVAAATPTGILAGSCGTFVSGGVNAGTYYPTSGANSASAPLVAPCVVQPSADSYLGAGYPAAATTGLHSAAQSLCDSSELTATVAGEQTGTAGHAGGTFVCGAELVVAVPASAAAPTVASSDAPAAGYQAFLTLTLS